jgi:hypothetical protein
VDGTEAALDAVDPDRSHGLRCPPSSRNVAIPFLNASSR